MTPEHTQASQTRATYVLSGEDIAPTVVERVMRRVASASQAARMEEIAYASLYAEQQRLADSPPDPRSASDHEFTRSLRRRLAACEPSRCEPLVRSIVERYAAEISGHFDRRVYRVATEVVPPALSALLRGFTLQWPGARDLDDRVLIEGEVETLRALAARGTVILAPTHVSNLDSLVLGAAIHRIGLPPFAYGAGLNLFSNPLIGFFMRNLGAYTVDRQKTDPLYRETLKQYTTVLLERGQHILFFPGGTRSRSGAIEQRLKMGLLGTAPVAFRERAASDRPGPLFVVPCTLTYPLVLEAPSLIGGYLRAEGGAQYLDPSDEFDRPRSWVAFFRGLRQLDQSVHLRVSAPLDFLGNDVDAAGVSHDARGRPVDPQRYLLDAGALVADDARDAEYTRLLSARLLQAYQRDNLALPSSVVAYALFERLRRASPQPNLFRFLRSLGPEHGVALPDVLSDVARVVRELEALEQRGAIRVEASVRQGDPRALVDRALTTFAQYHPDKVIEYSAGQLRSSDPALLFYYRNRLDGYGLLGTESALPAPAARSIGWGR